MASQFPILDLPIELRIVIYEHIIRKPGDICINLSWQRPPILALGPRFQDHATIFKLFFQSNTFVFYLLSLESGEPNLNDLILRLGQLSSQERKDVRRVNVVCFDSRICIEDARAKTAKAMEKQSITIEGGVVEFFIGGEGLKVMFANRHVPSEMGITGGIHVDWSDHSVKNSASPSMSRNIAAYNPQQ